MNHTRFPKEDHLLDWARGDNKVTKGDRVERIEEIDKLFVGSRQHVCQFQCDVPQRNEFHKKLLRLSWL